MNNEQFLPHEYPVSFTSPRLFTRKLSLDGRVPTSEILIPLTGSQRKGSFLVYPMNSEKQYVSEKTRIVFEDPLLHPVDGRLLFDEGITAFSYEKVPTTGEIADFFLTVRPIIDNESLPLLQGLVMATENDSQQWLGKFHGLIPTCSITASEGIRMYNGESFMFGYGPLYADSDNDLPISFGEEYLEQLESGFADAPDIERRNLQIEYTVFHDTVSVYDGGDSATDMIVNVRAGLILHRTPFKKIERACRRLLTKGSPDKRKIFNIVEPYYAVTAIPETWQEFEIEEDL